MDRLTGDWNRTRTEEFLRSRTIPLRLGCRTPDGNLWMLSLWYRYREGRLECATGATADVVRYLRESPDLAFEISTNEPPYMGVRGRGRATLTDEGKSVLRDLVERYLGGTDSDLAAWLLSDEREEVAIEIDVERAYTWDFSERMSDDEPETSERSDESEKSDEPKTSDEG